MKPIPTPVRKGGKRNLFCSYYRGCLDRAVKMEWNSWDCSACAHKRLIIPDQYGLFTPDNSVSTYSVPRDFSLYGKEEGIDYETAG